MSINYPLFLFLFLIYHVLILAKGLNGNGKHFQFTAPVYNVTLKENSRNKPFAHVVGAEKMGVYLPSPYQNVRFKIVEGDNQQYFKAVAQVLGNFAFLRIRHKHDDILNRELRSQYELFVKATLKRKNAATLETSALVNLMVLDENDNNPMFINTQYNVSIDDETPLYSMIVRLEAFDADEGINAELYFSLISPSDYFYVDAETGWIRTFAPVKPGNYTLDCLIEDRASRLFYQQKEDDDKPYFIRNKAKVYITVQKTSVERPKIKVEYKPLKLYEHGPQQVATISFDESSDRVLGLDAVLDDGSLKNKRTVAWSEKLSSNIFGLYLSGVQNSSTSVSVTVKDLVKNENLFIEKLNIDVANAERKIWIEGVEDSITVSVNESVPIGYMAYRIRGNTTYIQESGRIRYSIKETTSNLPFKIDPHSGLLQVTSFLDYDKKKEYEFAVAAKLDGFKITSEKKVFIKIQDSNNYCPKFVKYPTNSQLIIPPNFDLNQVLTKIEASDEDTGPNSEIFYKLIGENGSDAYFDINVTTGEIKILKLLPENGAPWVFHVMAMDNGWPLSLYSQLTLAVFSNNTKPASNTNSKIMSTCELLNKNSPVFKKNDEIVHIKEDLPVGSHVGSVLASDADHGYNGMVQYTTSDAFFALDPFTGDISVADDLAKLFEEKELTLDYLDYKLEIVASDMGGIFAKDPKKTKSAKTTVNIRIHDVNNNSPTFEQYSYRVKLRENNPPGMELLKVKATDKDPGNNGRMEYRLTVDTDLISIDPDTGVIRAEKSLDREADPCQYEYHFLVAAFDRGRPPKFAFANLTIEVEDVNDNSPRCLHHVSKAKISEDIPSGELVTCLAAHDIDSGDNAKIHFTLEKSNEVIPFRTDYNTGCIFVNSTEPFSFDKRSSYNFSVKISDAGTPVLSSHCQVEVELVPVNKNFLPPEFDDIAFEASISENLQSGSEVFTVKAVDPEGTPVIYRLVDGTGLGLFEFDKNTGVIRTTTVLDHEKAPSYWLTIRAEDTSSKPLFSYVHLFVRILDENDRAPIFSQPIYRAKIRENSPENKVVIKVVATDADENPSHGQNGNGQHLKYSIIRGNPQSYFVIDENTGYIVTGKRKLDRETQQEHEIVVQACDHGTPQLCTTVLVLIEVEDENDNAPSFKKPVMNVNVPARTKGFVTRIFARDADSEGPNSELTYRFVSPSDSRISVDDNGKISTSEPLKDGEKIQLVLVAKDQGSPQLEGNVTLTLNAIGRKRASAKSNKKPKFQDPDLWRELHISDRDSVGVIIGVIKATDEDSDLIWFKIDDNSYNPNETFAFVADTGELVLARSVDYIPLHVKEVRLNITVTDGRDEDRDQVVVKISRSANSRPILAETSKTVEVSQNLPVGSVIYTVNASFDESQSGVSHPHKIIYGIHQVDDVNAAQVLQINPSTGTLTLEKPISRQIAESFFVFISAKVGSAENFASLKINVRRSNDYAPQFIFDHYEFYVDSKLDADEEVGQVEAFDVDGNAIQYTIINGNEMNRFSINPSTGSIIAQEPIDPPTFIGTVLTIRATDSTSMPRSSTTKVSIKHSRSHISIPTLPEEWSNLRLSDTCPPKTFLTSMPSSSNRQERYRFVDKCEQLDINFATGVISTKGFFETNKQETIVNCSIMVSNSDGDNYTIPLSVRIQPTEVTSNEKLVYEGYVRENSPPGSTAYLDTNNNLPLILNSTSLTKQTRSKFNFISPQEVYFGIEQSSGVVRNLQSIDYEQHKFWEFYVTTPASDRFYWNSNPFLVHVDVIDTNDMSPIFTSRPTFKFVLPPVFGLQLGHVQAKDEDTIGNIRYAIRSNGLEKSLFSINPETGILSLATNNASDFKTNRYEVAVMASDGVHTTHSTVSVEVLDSNRVSLAKNMHFSKSEYKISILENTTIGKPEMLLSFVVLNTEFGEAISYKILNPMPYFTIQESTGILELVPGKVLDREENSKIELAIEARSLSNPDRFTTCIVHIDVQDINDCAPTFLNTPYGVSLSEEAKIGDKLVNIKAKDADLGLNGAIRYALEEGAPEFLEINKYDGRVTITKEPYVKQGGEFKFNVIAHDRGTPPLKSTAEVVVKVTNKNQPIFSSPRYASKISEAAAPGTTVLTIRASSNNGTLGYRIVEGDPWKNFDINFLTGVVSVNNPLDRELTPKFDLVIEAMDVTRVNASSTVELSIEIEDVNDCAPVFEKPIYRFTINEATSIGTLIGQVNASDPDIVPQNSNIIYSIAEGNKSVASLDALTGYLYLTSPVDFEETKFYEYTILAKDIDRLSSEATLILYVEDSNDNPPTFVDKNPLHLSCTSDFKSGHFLHQIIATDKDTVSNLPDGRLFNYDIVNGDETLFNLNSTNGVLTLVRELDQNEKQRMHFTRVLNISVSDGVFVDFLTVNVEFQPSMTTRSPVTFEQLTYSTWVSEKRTATNKSAIVVVSAVGGAEPLEYSIIRQENGPISIDSTSGRVYLNERLDREKVESINVPIMVTDAENQKAFTQLKVIVRDENDNEPEWIAPQDGYSLCLSKSIPKGDPVAMIMATDADVNDNLEYSLLSSSTFNPSKYFEIDPKQGYIKVKESLTDNDSKLVKFRVKVTDNGNPPHQKILPIEICLTDLTHNVPHFGRLRWTFAISEDASIGTVIGQISEFSHAHSTRSVKYAITSDGKLPFALEESTGNLVLKEKLDREKIAQYHFVVEVSSVNTPTLGFDKPFHSFAIGSVTVVDINDNLPKFMTKYDNIEVSEDSRVGAVVAVFMATDKDEGPNARISYSLLPSSQSSDFTIDREYGWLMVAKKLDREKKERYNLKVMASDEGGLNSTLDVVIEVTDINDSPPAFDKEVYVIKITKVDLPIGHVLLKPKIMDPDRPRSQNLKLYIVNGNEMGYFGVSAKNELLLNKLMTSVDVLSLPRSLNLLVSDGIFSSRARVKLDYTFDSPSTCHSFHESLKIPGNLTTGSIIYHLRSSSPNEIYVHHLIDNDKLPFEILNNSNLAALEGYYKKRNYDLRIKSKREYSSSMKRALPEPSCLSFLNVTVQNSNRNAPKFLQAHYTVNVPEDVNVTDEKRHFLVKLDAIDEDLDDFGQLTYILASMTGSRKNKINGLFAVDERTGVLTLLKPIDHEDENRYELVVRAEDGGGLKATAKVTVNIDDVNDNPPTFEQPVYRLKVLENEPVGYELMKVEAVDKDKNQNITYEILPENQNSEYFEISPNGVLKLAKPLDYETLHSLKVMIKAKDNGEPPLSSTCEVEVEILDVNDNAPRFEKTLYEVNVDENAQVGTKIVKVFAVDSDSEHFGKVSYTLNGDDAEFFDVQDDGTVVLMKELDYEKKPSLKVNIRASDGGEPQLIDDTILVVTVNDINDNAPVFETCPLSAVVQEGMQPGQTLLTVVMTDADSEANGGPFKLELSGEGSDSFSFDPLMNLITARQLVFSQKEQYDLNVTAYDAQGLSTICPLRIYVKQQSRHPPEIQPLLVMLNTLHGEFLGGPIGKAKATDKDPSDMLRYSIVDNNTPGSNQPRTSLSMHSAKFFIDPETGELSAQSDILPGLHRFNVSVTDGRYIVYAPVDVDVSNIDQDALDHSVSIRIKRMSAEKFIKSHMCRFYEALAHILGISVTNVRILSIQNIFINGSHSNAISGHQAAPKHRHRRQQSDIDLDVLFTVSRGESRGYHRPSFVKQRIERSINELLTDSRLDIVSLTSEVCRRDVCLRGECRDRLWLENVDQQSIYDVDGTAFVSPRHVRTFECICRQGYAGRHCDVSVNKCSKEQCAKHEMCIPIEEETTGFTCACPPGFRGDRCSEPTCEDSSDCSQGEELSLLGNGYFQLFVANSLETRLELSVQFKTVSHNTVLMHGQGLHDFHTIQIVDGYIEYRWNCGTGEASAKLTHARVDEGQWHKFKVSRRGRHSKVTIDDTHQAEATSPPGSDVVNLYTHATVLTFGAKVKDSSLNEDSQQRRSLFSKYADSTTDESSLSFSSLLNQHREVASNLIPTLEQGMIGCFGRISLDGFDVSKTDQGLRLYNTRIGCDTEAMGPCLSVPCQNHGQCLPNKTANSFTCLCSSRYTGPKCEIDLNACAGNPCPKGIPCHNLYNDFHCSCPVGFTGKTCQMRGDWDPCVTNPCGPYGFCVRQKNSFICNCSNGFTGDYCADRVPKIIADQYFFTSIEFYVFVGTLFVCLIIAGIGIFLCRRSNMARYEKKHGMKDIEPASNPLMSDHTTLCHTTIERAPPPLPPRATRCRVKSSGSNLPTVEVRPMQSGRSSHVVGSNSRFLEDHSPVCSNLDGSRRNPGSTGTGSTTASMNNNLESLRQYGSAADDLERITNDEMIRRFGRGIRSIDLDEDESSELLPTTSSGGNAGDISSSGPLFSSKRLGDSIQCLPTNDPDITDSNRMMEMDALENIRREKEKLQYLTTNVLKDFDNEQNSDYLTMKPIFRAKPFQMGGRTNLEKPPPPPAHRNVRLEQDRTETTKLYDNPNDDTLSNITSNEIDD